MSITRACVQALAVFLVALCAEGAMAQVGNCVRVGEEFRINSPSGPNAAGVDPNNLDPNDADFDDDFYVLQPDESYQLIPQLSAVGAVLESPALGGDPFFFAAWDDRSWMWWYLYEPPIPGILSTDWSVGLAFATDLGGASWTYDIARSEDGEPASGHLAPPPNYAPPDDPNDVVELGWLEIQEQVRTAVGGNGYLYMVGVNRGAFGGLNEGKDSIFLARTTDPNSGTWEVYTVVANKDDPNDLWWDAVSTPFVGAGAPGEPYENHVYVTWVHTRTIRAQEIQWPAIYFAESRDGGQSFSKPQQISGFMDSRVDDTASPVTASAVDSRGDVYVVWYHPSETLDTDIEIPDAFEVRRFVPDPNRAPGQGTWYPDPNDFPDSNVIAEFNPLTRGEFTGDPDVSNIVGLLEQPAVAVDRHVLRRGWLYVAYASEDRFDPNAPGWGAVPDANIWFARLRPGAGGAWLEKVSDDEPQPNQPYPRYDHALAFDNDMGLVVMHGGLYNGGGDPGNVYVSGETALWDGSSWYSVAWANPVYGHAMAYDINRKRVVLFGGKDINDLPQGETWEWDGSNWTQQTATPAPGARYQHAMAYDSTRGVVVLFGGKDQNNLLGDTWEWDGSQWVLRATSGPTARWKHAMAYDMTKNEVVLFGGEDASSSGSDTWVWDGDVWTPKGATGPTERYDHGVAYDATWERVVLFGGRNAAGNPLGDTWLWDGATWAQHTGAPNPSPRYAHAMAYSGRVGVVLFAGRNASHLYQDVWEWETSAWEGPWQVNSDQPDPPPGWPGGGNEWMFGATSQYMPALAINRAGHLGLSWLDCRDDIYETGDPNDVMNQAYRCYLTWSTHGGEEWREDDPNDPNEFGVSGEPINPRAGLFQPPFVVWPYTPVTLGQYRGMGAWGRKFLPLWVSLRDWPTLANYHDPWFSSHGLWAPLGQQIGDIYGSVVEVVIPVPPDYEPDCDVDLDDFGVFASCYNGSNRPPALSCPPGADADYDDDGDVDLDDFGIFAEAYTGTTNACAGDPCESAMGGGQGPTAQGGFDPATSSDPTILMLYAMLYAYCQENDVPFP